MYPFWLSLLCLVVVVVVVVNQFSCVFDSSFLLLCIFFDHVPSISLSLSVCLCMLSNRPSYCLDVSTLCGMNQSIKSNQSVAVRFVVVMSSVELLFV